jgi:N6-adenosine-specific RNA methylase IME4
MLDQTHTRFESGPFAGLPRGYFRIALADPGWKFRTWSPRGEGKSAGRHYRCEEFEQIMLLPVGELMASDSILFLCVVQTHFLAAMQVIEAWDFEYKTVGFDWIKMPKTWSADQLPLRIRPRMGCGYYTRANSEQCWIARRGKAVSVSIEALIKSYTRPCESTRASRMKCTHASSAYSAISPALNYTPVNNARAGPRGAIKSDSICSGACRENHRHRSGHSWRMRPRQSSEPTL